MDMDFYIYPIRKSSPNPSEINLQEAFLSDATQSNPTAGHIKFLSSIIFLPLSTDSSPTIQT